MTFISLICCLFLPPHPPAYKTINRPQVPHARLQHHLPPVGTNQHIVSSRKLKLSPSVYYSWNIALLPLTFIAVMSLRWSITGSTTLSPAKQPHVPERWDKQAWHTTHTHNTHCENYPAVSFISHGGPKVQSADSSLATYSSANRPERDR